MKSLHFEFLKWNIFYSFYHYLKMAGDWHSFENIPSKMQSFISNFRELMEWIWIGNKKNIIGHHFFFFFFFFFGNFAKGFRGSEDPIIPPANYLSSFVVSSSKARPFETLFIVTATLFSIHFDFASKISCWDYLITLCSASRSISSKAFFLGLFEWIVALW